MIHVLCAATLSQALPPEPPPAPCGDTGVLTGAGCQQFLNQGQCACQGSGSSPIIVANCQGTCGCCASPHSGIKYTPEFARVVKHRKGLDFDNVYSAAHGLSLLLVAGVCGLWHLIERIKDDKAQL